MPSHRSRRQALSAGAAVLAALAGCTTTSEMTNPESTSAASETAETDETAQSPESASLTVDSVTVTPALVAPNSPDSIGTFGKRDEQFALATVRSDSSSVPDRSAFTLATDDDTYDPIKTEKRLYTNALWDDEDGYVDISANHLVFSVPKPLDTSTVTLRWSSGEHFLGDDAVERLARPPTDFEYTLSAPERVTSGEQMTLNLTVNNVGDVDGTFVGALNRSGPDVAYTPITGISLDVEAGKSTTWTYSFRPSTRSDDVAEMRLHVNWRDDYRSQTVSVEPVGITANRTTGSPSSTTETPAKTATPRATETE